MNNKNIIALNIETRSVTGIILKVEDNKYTLLDFIQKNIIKDQCRRTDSRCGCIRRSHFKC